MQFTASMEVAAQKIPFFVLALLVAVSSSSLRAKGEEALFDVSKLEMFVDELPGMPKLQGYAANRDGVFVHGNLTVGMYKKFWKFHRDLPPTRVFAYGTSKDAATVPGPTIEARRGVPTYVTWTNHLPSRHVLPWDPTIPTAKAPSGGVPTVVHLHGGIHPPTSDGNSLAWFTSGFAAVGPTFAGATAFYPNKQPPGNLWYHDHAMGLTRANLLAGLVGTYVLRAPDLEEPLHLPSGPELDRFLVLFDRSFLADGSLYMNATGNNPSIHPQWQPEFFGSAVVVNGKAWPFLRVRRRRYRFRILNASNARFFHLFFSGASSESLRFIHIGSDAYYLPRPVSSRKFLLAPSEFADVVVDFSKLSSSVASVVLANDAPYPYPSGDPADELSGRVMQFVIERGVESDPSGVPERLLQLPAPSVDFASTTRYIAMYEYESEAGEPTHLYLNARPYEAPATETPTAGSSELWAVINLTEDNHPLHVHLATFTVLDQRELADTEAFGACMRRTNDALACGVEEPATLGRRIAVAPHERGWKNVYKMRPGVVTRILLRFAPLDGVSYSFDPTAEPGYVYHCHILDHEDNEMMRPLKLVQ